MPDYSSAAYTPSTLPQNQLSTPVSLTYDSRGVGGAGDTLILRLYPTLGGLPIPVTATLLGTGHAVMDFSTPSPPLSAQNYNATIEISGTPFGEIGINGVLFNVSDPTAPTLLLLNNIMYDPGSLVFGEGHTHQVHVNGDPIQCVSEFITLASSVTVKFYPTGTGTPTLSVPADEVSGPSEFLVDVKLTILTLPVGIYDVSVTDFRGHESNKLILEVFVEPAVPDPPPGPPPDTTPGAPVTVVGAGLSEVGVVEVQSLSGGTIFTPPFVVSSDGTHLTFTMPTLAFVGQFKITLHFPGLGGRIIVISPAGTFVLSQPSHWNTSRKWKATLLGQLIQAQAPGLVVLARVGVFEPAVDWTLAAGRAITYQVPIVQYTSIHSFRTIDIVRIADPAATTPTPIAAASANTITVNQVVATSLDQQLSVPAVEANPGSFYHDTLAGILYVSLADSSTPAGKSVLAGFYLYFSPGMPEAGAVFVDPDGNTYWPYLTGVPSISKRLSNPFFGVVTQGGGSISLAAATGNLDGVFAQYIWEQGEVTVYLGGDNLPFSEYRAFPLGKTLKKTWTEREIRLDVADATQDLLVKFPRTLFTAADAATEFTFYRGGNPALTSIVKKPTDVEATAATTRVPVGQPKPLAYGNVVHAAPTALAIKADRSQGMWCVAHHPNYSITAVRIAEEEVGVTGAGSTFTWSMTADLSHLFIQASGSTDVSAPLVTFTGKRADSDGTPIMNFADIVKDMVSVECGLTTAFDTAVLDRSRFLCNMYVPSIYLATQAQLVSVLDTLTRSTLGYFYMSAAGLYRFDVWCPSIAAEQTLDEAWGDFLDYQASTDAARMFQTIFVEYGLDPGRKSQVKDAGAGSTAAQNVGSTLLVSVSRAECAAVILDRTATFTISGTFLADEDSAFVLGTRYARFCQSPALVLPIKSRLRAVQLDVMSRVTSVKRRQPVAPGRALHAQVNGITFDFSAFTVGLDMDNQRVIGTQAFIGSDAAVPWISSTVGVRESAGFWTNYPGFSDDSTPAAFGGSRWF